MSAANKTVNNLQDQLFIVSISLLVEHYLAKGLGFDQARRQALRDRFVEQA